MGRFVVTDFSGQTMGPIFMSQEVQEKTASLLKMVVPKNRNLTTNIPYLTP